MINMATSLVVVISVVIPMTQAHGRMKAMDGHHLETTKLILIVYPARYAPNLMGLVVTIKFRQGIRVWRYLTPKKLQDVVVGMPDIERQIMYRAHLIHADALSAVRLKCMTL